jgi:mannobiose 2-epimerase
MPLSLHTLRQEVYQEYFRILDYWKTYAVDHTQGGFYGQVNGQNQPVAGAPKAIVINSRILWTFSTAVNHFQKTQYLPIATRAYDYIRKHFVDPQHKGVYWSVNADGTPQETRKQMYGHAFAMYGLSEFYKATKTQAALDQAVSLFSLIEQYSFDAKNGGYIEAFGQDWSATDDYILSKGDSRKSMNTHLHLLEAYTNLYRVWKDKTLQKQLKNMIDAFLQHIIDATTFRMRLFFDNAWNVKTDVISYGHDIEASWLLWEAAEVLNDKALLKTCRETSVRMAKAAMDGWEPDGGMNYELEPSKNLLNRERSWWVMAEAMVGFMNAYQLTGKVQFLDKAVQSWEFIKKHLIDSANGEWFSGVTPEHAVTSTDKVNFWKCPYHNSRACLEIWHRTRKK